MIDTLDYDSTYLGLPELCNCDFRELFSLLQVQIITPRTCPPNMLNRYIPGRYQVIQWPKDSRNNNIVTIFSGNFCPLNTGFGTQYPCPNGTFNNVTNAQDDSYCQLCTPGWYCPWAGMAEPAGQCASGYYCTLGSWSDKPAVLGNESDSGCHCPGMSTGGMCLAGTYCPPGSHQPIECDPGSFCQSDELDSVSGDCMGGHFCSGGTILPNPVNDTTGDVCPMGNYCPPGSATATPCDPGTYSDRFANQNMTDCLPCTAGQFCSGFGRDWPNGPCDMGWYCPEGSTVPQPAGNECLPGHMCPQGSADQTPCLSGWYQPVAGQGECLMCPAGSYCDQDEAIAELQSGVGAPSHGVVTPKPCPLGFFCPNGTATARQFPCPVGHYSNTTSLESESECRDCPYGYYCDAENITMPTGPCTAGFYCVLGAVTPTPMTPAEGGGPCWQGTYCKEGTGYPNPCPKGTYGDRDQLPSMADCTICPPGEFCASSGLNASSGDCLAGFFCNNGSWEANPVGQVYGDECPGGHYCPAHSYEPTPCPAGTYQPSTRRTDISACLDCEPGKFCNDTGLTAVSGDCDPRFYCSLGASSPAPLDGITGDICPAGSHCPAGSAFPVACSNGTYTNYTGAALCDICPERYYCVHGDRAEPCLIGFYCPEGTGADLQPCPPGTYNPTTGLKNESECVECDGGSYCLTPGLSAVSGDCQAGHYCQQGRYYLYC